VPPTDEPVSILTRREREVATLVAKILKKLSLDREPRLPAGLANLNSPQRFARTRVTRFLTSLQLTTLLRFGSKDE
jgi:hypothetical protein